jgi:outer membrane protein assembly factor BamA
LAAHAYSALDTVGPRLWVPWVATSAESGTLFGFVTGGQDVLQRHRWLLNGLYGPESGRLMHTFLYAYDGLRPTFSLLSADVDRTYADLVPGPAGYADYTERERSAGLVATLTFPGLEASQAVSLGYRYRYLTAQSPPPAVTPPGEEPATGSLGAARLGWAYTNAHRQAFSISPEGGRSVRLGLERAQEGLGSDRTFTRASADWAEYLALPPRRHVLLARLFAGTAGGDTPAQGAFSLGGESPGDVSLSIDDAALPLRGYPLNAFRGDQALLGGLEYRFPLREIGRGGETAPFFLRRLHGALFVDAGEAWDGGGFSAGDLRTGVGAELRLDLSLSYFLPLTLRLGVAWGLDEEGGVYPTLALTMPQGLLGAATPTGRR